MKNKEVWTDIKDYEGLYQVSNHGNVKNVKTNKLLKPFSAPNGYNKVKLYKNKTTKIFSLHRLVANAFLDNECNKPEINHLDENKSNNNADNLGWCTRRENVRWSLSKPLLGFNDENVIVANCLSDLQRVFCYNKSTISNCCNGKKKSAYKRRWVHISKWLYLIFREIAKNSKEIIVI